MIVLKTSLIPYCLLIHLISYKKQWQVLSEYRSRGLDFVMQVINEPTYLEDLTGLTELMKSANYSRVEWVDDDDDDGEFADI